MHAAPTPELTTVLAHPDPADRGSRLGVADRAYSDDYQQDEEAASSRACFRLEQSACNLHLVICQPPGAVATTLAWRWRGRCSKCAMPSALYLRGDDALYRRGDGYLPDPEERATAARAHRGLDRGLQWQPWRCGDATLSAFVKGSLAAIGCS